MRAGGGGGGPILRSPKYVRGEGSHLAIAQIRAGGGVPSCDRLNTRGEEESPLRSPKYVWGGGGGGPPCEHPMKYERRGGLLAINTFRVSDVLMVHFAPTSILCRVVICLTKTKKIGVSLGPSKSNGPWAAAPVAPPPPPPTSPKNIA